MGFSFSINISNFEAFLSVFKLTKNPLFLKSEVLLSLSSYIEFTYLHSCVFNSVSKYLRSWTKIEYSPKEKGNTCPGYLSFNPIFQIPIYIGNTYQVVLTFIIIRYLVKKDLSSTPNKIDK